MTYQASSSKASILDIVSEESLRASLKPAWEFLLTNLSTSSDALNKHASGNAQLVEYAKSVVAKWITQLKRYSDEAFLCIMLVFERHYLDEHCASFTESFYEMARKFTTRSTRFTKRHAKILSLLSLTLFPYLLDKLKKAHDSMRDEYSIHAVSSSANYFKYMFYKLFPLVLSISKFVKFAVYVLYIFDFTDYSSAMMALIGVQMKCQEEAESKEEQTVPDDMNRGFTNTLLSTVGRGILNAPSALVKRVASVTPVLFFLVEFLDTWNDMDDDKKKVVRGISVPKPPVEQVWCDLFMNILKMAAFTDRFRNRKI